MKNISKKSAGLLVIAIALILVITLTGIRDLSSTYAYFVDANGNNYIIDKNGFGNLYILEGTSAAPGERVYLELNAEKNKWEYISVFLNSVDSDHWFVVYLKDINTARPYFIIPYEGDGHTNGSSVPRVGEKYELGTVVLWEKCIDENGNICDKTKSYTTIKTNTSATYMDVGERKYFTVKSPNNQAETNTQKMTIEKFSFLNNDVKYNDKVYIDFKYSSTVNIKGCSLWLYNTEPTTSYLSLPIKDFNTKPYVLIERTTAGNIPLAKTYKLMTMVCTPENDQGETIAFTQDKFLDTIQYNFNSEIRIKESTDSIMTSDFRFVRFNIVGTEAQAGDEVTAEVVTTKPISSTLLTFYNPETKETLPVYLKGVEKTYFTIPSTAKAGVYELQNIIMRDSKHTYTIINDNGKAIVYEDQYQTNNKITVDINKKLTIKEAETNKKVLIFNNEDYSEEIKNKIIGLDEDAVITVFANNMTLIDKGLFEAIRETRRTLIIEYGESEWVFSGTDIENPKSIDVSMIVSDITNKNFGASFISSLPKKSQLLTFSDNGNLPGKVLIRLRSFKLDNTFGEDKLFIYYYDKDADGLMKVAMEIEKENGYYEFYINHNSDYILANKAISGKYVLKDTDYLKLNADEIIEAEPGKDYSPYIIIAGVVIALILIIIKIIPKKEKNA